MLSTVCSAKQKSLQMCAELRYCQRWVTNRERQRVPQWWTRDRKTYLSVKSLFEIEVPPNRRMLWRQKPLKGSHRNQWERKFPGTFAP